MAAMLAASRAEDGCLAYNYAQDVLDPCVIHISERWRDRAALDAHFATPHMAAWRAQFGAIGISDRDLRCMKRMTACRSEGGVGRWRMKANRT